MPKAPVEPSDSGVPLKDPGLAALLAWLWPGAGHLYQGRSGKGAVLMICIVATFLFGLYLSQGRGVYIDRLQGPIFGGGGGIRGRLIRVVDKLPYFCQLPAGVLALPAVVRARSGGNAADDLFAPSNWYAPPRNERELDELHRRLHRNFELGKMYTMIAGLLNVLAIYDAWKGPAHGTGRRDEEPSDDREGPAGEPA